MPATGKENPKLVIVEVIGDLLRHGHGADGGVARVHPLRQRHHVWNDAEVIAAEPLSGPAKSRHDLVSDQENPVLVTDFAQSRKVFWGSHVEPGDDWLDDDGGDLIRAFELDDLVDVLDALDMAARVGLTEGAAEAVLPEGVDRANEARTYWRPCGRASNRTRTVAGSVVTLVAGDDLIAARVQAGDRYRHLDRLASAQSKVALDQIAGRELRNHLAQGTG